MQQRQQQQAKAAPPVLPPPPSAPPAPSATDAEIDEEYVRNLSEEMSQHVMTMALKQAQLPYSGTKAQQARRIANAYSMFQGSRPTRPQLVYMAAATRRQGLGATVQELASTADASLWLSRHGDYHRR